MLIAQLRPVHAPDYRALMLEAYALHPEAFSSSVAERAALPLPWWQLRLSEEPLAAERVLGVFQDDRLAGVAGLSFESREKLRHKATLFGMYVPDRFRQQGLGRRLVQAVLAQAAERPGVRLVQLTVTQGNEAARALYESCGFVAYGVEPFAVAAGPAYVSKIHMWCNIGFPDASLF
ncbi:GNAT family N-acetyltransferase [Polaromonas sp.]|uniref:GNAT family N-acetyltransferase n=1 Tax=Polaromonas sp. TaxID=1869339 RepID=UPI002489280C|nr:GNAT family N-acetyltransferase [Polaromonas sp.]MDI1275268.1 GNAT family N-acetyltransferase [Polaromonas sp.]